MIVKLVNENNTLKLSVGLIWNEAINTIPGRLNPGNRNEYQTKDYGVLHRNTLSQKIVDAFGVVRDRNSDGSVLIFDEEKIKELKMMYGYKYQDKAKVAPPDVNVEPMKIKDGINQEDEIKSSVSHVGYRVCGFIHEQIEE